MIVFVPAVAAFLSGAMIGGFALVVTGIRKGDRPNRLARKPSTHVEAIALRVLGVGTRTAEHVEDDEGEL